MHRRRRRTALLLAGWFLLQPPWSRNVDGRLAFDTTRPLGEWEQESRYENRRDCEQAHYRLFQLRMCGPGSALDPSDVDVLTLFRLAAARCVAADAP